MRWLFIAIVALGALYSGYWALGRMALGRGLEQGEAQLAAQGIALDYRDRALTGFPSRFDLSYRDLDLAGPGWRWQVPLVQVFTLAYKPNHLILFAPGPHEIATAHGAFALSSDDARASLRVGAERLVPLREARLDIMQPHLSGTVEMRADRAFAALSAQEDPAKYEATLALAELALPVFAQADGLPQAISRIQIVADATLDAPLDRDGNARHIEHLHLKQAEMQWGDAQLSLTGEIHRGEDGRADGSLEMVATSARPVLVFLTQDLAPREAEQARLLWESAERDGTLRLIFTIRAGQVFLGPIPIGDLPALP